MWHNVAWASLIAVLVGVCGPLQLAAYTPETLASAIRALIPETPLLVDVARCESGLRQFDAAGKPLRGGLGGSMIGLFQFHEKYHWSAALALGYNLDTLLGNIAYARALYAAQGITPWESSRHCWGSEIGKLENQQIAETRKPENQETGKFENKETTKRGNHETAKPEYRETVETAKLTKTLRFGTIDPEVRVLQTLLRSAGYPATAPGAETNYFGVATYKALLAFQCAQSIACLRDPKLRAGAGVVDERTRTALHT